MPNALAGVLRVVPEENSVALTEEEAAAILEIAFLAIAADRKLSDEELEAFRAVAGRLRDLVAHSGDPSTPASAQVMSDREFELILESFSADLDRNVADERLRVLGAQLERPDVRALAYKIAYALALCDLNTSDEEFEFDLQLVEALELTHDATEALEDEVLAAFQDE